MESKSRTLDLPGSCDPVQDDTKTCQCDAANQRRQRNEPTARKPSSLTDLHQEPVTERKQTEVLARRDSVVSKASNANAWAVAKAPLSQSSKACDKLAFVDAVEPAMQLYLNDSCSDGPSAWVRGARTAGFVLSLLVLLPLLSFAPLLIPFSAPHEGFVSNWTFNFVAHPILNYVPARGSLEVLVRGVIPQERHRVCLIVRWIPLVASIVCLLIHGTASLFGIFPLPFSAMTSCAPAVLATNLLAKQLMPTDLLVQDFRQFVKFMVVTWAMWIMQILILMGYLIYFPLVSPIYQVLLSSFVTCILGCFAFAMEILAVWTGVPKYYAAELKPMVYFVSFLFTAALFSSAKSVWVFVLMLVQDAGKALAVLSKTWIFLSNYFVRVDADAENVRENKSLLQKYYGRIEAKVSSVRETTARL